MHRLLNLVRYPELARLAWWRWVIPFRLRLRGVKISPTARFLGMPIVSMVPESRIQIGARVNVCSRSEYTALGINHAVVLRTLRPGAVLEIGEDTGMSGTSICAAIHVSIGRGCLIGANVTITDTDCAGDQNPSSVNQSISRFFDWLRIYYISTGGRTTEAVAPILIETTAFLIKRA